MDIVFNLNPYLQDEYKMEGMGFTVESQNLGSPSF